MRPIKNLDHLESFCVLLFAVAIFIWKPGIYVASGLICLYLILRTAIEVEFRNTLWNSTLAKLSLGMYAVGLITATLGAETYQDVAWMARKTLFLPIVVFLAFALKRRVNQQLAMTGLVIGFWIASVITLSNHDWQLNFGGRMGGTWLLGTWDSLLGLFFPFMVLYLIRTWSASTTWLTKAIYVITTIMACVMMLLAGGRAPWLGALIGLMIYFLILKPNRKLLLGMVGITAVVGMIGLTVFQDKVQPIVDRFATVTDTTTDGSNWVRLRLWEIGGHQLVDFAKNDPLSLAFGGGALSYDAKQIEFFKTLSYDPDDRKRLQEYGYPTGDTHNTYIDNALRHGVVWTALITLYLIGLCTRFSWRYMRSNPEPSVLLVGLLVVSMFYTMVPHFATFFFVLFVGLLMPTNTKSN